jgi:hypothetical protein
MESRISHNFTDLSHIEDSRLSGSEVWPIRGDLATAEQVREILHKARGLSRRRDCFQKSLLAHQVLGGGLVTVGGVIILGRESDYIGCGCDFRLDESTGLFTGVDFHSWLMFDAGVVDIALGGWMEWGTLSGALKGREPFVLAGLPPAWVLYLPQAAWSCTFDGDEAKLTMVMGPGGISPSRLRALAEEVMSGRFRRPWDFSGVFFL